MPYDLNRLYQALKNADSAGDVNAARVLAQEIKRLRSLDSNILNTTPQPQVKQPVVESNFKKIELSSSHIEHIKKDYKNHNYEFIIFGIVILFFILKKIIK